jgi:hypothetical protein
MLGSISPRNVGAGDYPTISADNELPTIETGDAVLSAYYKCNGFPAPRHRTVIPPAQPIRV